jgi:hypothetical protein
VKYLSFETRVQEARIRKIRTRIYIWIHGELCAAPIKCRIRALRNFGLPQEGNEELRDNSIASGSLDK